MVISPDSFLTLSDFFFDFSAMKKTFFIFVPICIALLISACDFKASDDDTGGKTVQLSWETPTTREDGQSLYHYEIGGYEIKYRNVNDDEYHYLILLAEDSDNPADGTSVELSDDGTYEFSVAVFDVNGLYSLYSDVVQITID